MERKSILFVDHDDQFSGSSISLSYLIQAFKKNGYKVLVATPKSSQYLQRFENMGAQIVKIPPRLHLVLHFTNTVSSFSFKGLRSLFYMVIKIVLVQILGIYILIRYRPSLVYINEYVYVHFALISKVFLKPVVIHIRSQFLHGKLGVRRYILKLALLNLPNYTISITNKDAKQLGNRRKKNLVVREFLNSSDFDIGISNRELRRALNLQLNTKLILMLGGILQIKGSIEFIKSLKYLLEKRNDVFYIVIGINFSYSETEYYKECLKFIEEENLNDHISLRGQFENVKDILSVADIVVSSSVVSHFSRPVIEAWARKKPAVCSDICHSKEIIKDKINGLLYHKYDPEDLALKLNTLLTNPELLKRISENGYKDAKNLYSEANIDSIINICNKLLK